MEPNVTVENLNDSIINPIVMCRVVKQWDIILYNVQSCRSMRFMLVDDQEHAIEAEMFKIDHQLLPVKPIDGEIYVFRQFRVNKSRDEYNATSHKYIIRFHKFTQVIRVKNTDRRIPRYYFNFRDIGDIGSADLRKPKIAVDVIGRLSAIGEIRHVPTITGVYTKDILLANQINQTIRVTLWSEFMDIIQDEVLKEMSKTKPVVVAFSSLELRYFNGTYSLKTFSATKIYTDPDFSYIMAFAQTLGDDTEPIELLPPLEIQPSRASKLTTPIAMTLQEMIELEPYSSANQQYVCEATIADILSKDNWCYTACTGCKTTLLSKDCERCQITDATSIQWYRVAVQVNSGLAYAIFILMGKQAEHVVGLKANALLDEAQRTSRMLPYQLTNIVGRRFRFVVEINLQQFHKNRLCFDVNQAEELQCSNSGQRVIQNRLSKRPVTDDSPRTSDPNIGHTGLHWRLKYH
ncbi:Replication protein A 70 kDa DNA-binding subunit B [Rhynchospora pubera]|uniref:Replication protein A 70 kDa DNA-binding subunit B n=1 Tax=Rhynchospora pubera TaxID=906938 RepID=A0AAV8CLV0_9POAL|nr:Replication protein A 70 kDa DNA-binding subunit B [Rhynchospora pubera]